MRIFGVRLLRVTNAYFWSETPEGPSAKHPAQIFTGVHWGHPTRNPCLLLVQLGIGPGKKLLETTPTTTACEVGFWLRGRQEPLSEPFHWLAASTTPTSLMTSSFPLDIPKASLPFLGWELKVASKEESWWPSLKEPRFFMKILFSLCGIKLKNKKQNKTNHSNQFYFLTHLIPTPTLSTH